MELDKHYNIVIKKANETLYDDELHRVIERILSLKEKGKIHEAFAKKLIKKYIEVYFEDEVQNIVTSIIPIKQNQPKGKNNGVRDILSRATIGGN